MRQINFKTHVLPHLIALLVFFLLVVLYFNPLFFENKSLNQHDILQWQGGAQELIDYRERTGEEGLWTNSMFSGMPGYLINVQWDNYLIEYLQLVMAVGLPHPVRYLFLAFLSYYILLLSFGVRPYLAIAGAIAFGFTSYNIIGISAGHNARIGAVAYMPLVLAGTHLTFGRNKILGFALTASGLALQLRVNHLQITYYLLLIIIIYMIYRLAWAIKEETFSHFFKTNLILLGAAILAIGTFFGSFWATYEYSRYSMRGPSELTATTQNTSDGLARDYAFQFSNEILEPMVLFIPNFYGGSLTEELGRNSNLAQALRANGIPPVQVAQQIQSVPTYWGSQSATAPYYAGAIIFLLLVLGILKFEIRYTWWLLLAIALSLMLSWGDNFAAFNYFMFEYFPGYNKFRSVTFSIIIAIFCMPILGFTALEAIFKEGLTKENQKKLFLAVAITAGIAILSIIIASFTSFRGAIDDRLANLPPWFLEAVRADRRSSLQIDAFRTLVIIIASGAIFYFYLKRKLGELLAYSLLIIIMVFDHWQINRRYLDNEEFQKNPAREFFAETEADQYIKQDNDLHYRVYNLQNPFNEARTSYHRNSIGGYHGAKPRRYQDLIEHCIAPETNTMITELQAGSQNFENYHILNMLNAKYIMFGSARNNVIRNEANLGNAWLVEEVRPVNNPDEELQELCNIETEQVALVDVSRFDVPSTNFNTNGNIQLEAYEPNYLRYNFQGEGESFVVFSEIYYPEGWEVTIDGEQSEHLRANFVLRAMMVPAGNHTIEFNFRPRAYKIGNPVMLISSILVILMLIFSIFWSFRNNKAVTQTN
ncbi:YfhO family protein [soil metagenome]